MRPPDATDGKPGDIDELKLFLHAEEVAVARRQVGGDIVKLSTVTTTQDHLVEENLHHERVEIERITIGRPVAFAPPVREEGDVTILSVVEEVVVVERRLILKEEVRVRRVRTTEPHRETVALRAQKLVVTRTHPETGETHVVDPDAITPPIKENTNG